MDAKKEPPSSLKGEDGRRLRRIPRKATSWNVYNTDGLYLYTIVMCEHGLNGGIHDETLRPCWSRRKKERK